MKAVRITAPKELSIVDIKEPKLTSPEDVKIRVAYSGVCPDEMPFFKKDIDMMAWGSVLFPEAGHEMSGIIVEAGEKAMNAGFTPGTRVGGYAWEHCGHCSYCRSGRENLCSNLTPCQSSLSEYVVWKMSQLIKLPDDVSLKAGVLVDPIGFSLHGIDRAELKIDSAVLIIGATADALILTQLCKMRGAGFVTVTDPYYENRQLAESLGADYVVEPSDEVLAAHTLKVTGNKGYDYIFETSGNIKNMEVASKFLAKQGKLMFCKTYGFNIQPPVILSELFIKEASLIPFHMAPYKLPATQKIMSKLILDPLISKVYPMEEATQAYLDTDTGIYPHIAIKVNDIE